MGETRRNGKNKRPKEDGMKVSRPWENPYGSPYRILKMVFFIVLLGCGLACTSPKGSVPSETEGGGGSGTGWVVTVTAAQKSLPNSIPDVEFPVLSSTTVLIRVVDSSGSPPPNGTIVYLTCSNGSFGFKLREGYVDYTQPITSTQAALTQGQAVVTFTAGFVGPSVAVVTATYGGATGSETIEIFANPYTT